MEMKSGVGGSESSLFLGDLLRMYQRLANVNRWKAQVVAQNDNDGGGTKDAIIEIKGEGAYDALRCLAMGRWCPSRAARASN